MQTARFGIIPSEPFLLLCSMIAGWKGVQPKSYYIFSLKVIISSAGKALSSAEKVFDTIHIKGQ